MRAKAYEVRRVFIVDAACVQTTGHNLYALQCFADLLRAEGEVHVLGCCYLEHAVSVETGVRRFFDWYYPNIFTRAQFPLPADLQREGQIEGDRFEVAAIRDAKRLLSSYDVTSRDLIVFPSADIYGVLGMLRAVWARPPNRRPLICIRLINVMEHAAPAMTEPRETLLDFVAAALANGLPISVSAETAKYAAYVGQRLRINVPITSFPSTGTWKPLPSFGPFVVGHLGTARRDKGFFDILPVMKAVRLREGPKSIRFLIQVPGEVEAFENIEYLSQLYALPGVQFVPDRLGREEWIVRMAECHCLLLPYDVRTYALRGSAIATEAINLGRLLVTTREVGFAPEVDYYNVGAV